MEWYTDAPYASISGLSGLWTKHVERYKDIHAWARPSRRRVPKYHCPRCNRYFRHRFTGILPRFRATEAYRLEVFEAHEGGVTQRKLSRTHRIGTATVERWYQSFVKQRVSELSGRPCPQVLGIDEHFFTRKKGYATTLVDLKNHKVWCWAAQRRACAVT